jgi:hypothetical protein
MPGLDPGIHAVRSQRIATQLEWIAGSLASERHEVDLAYGRLVAPGDDAVTFEAKQEGGDGFGKQPVTVGPNPLLAHGRSLPLRSSVSPSS